MPWWKFRIQDWRDPGLQLCPPEVRCFLIDLKCIATEGEPLGQVAVNGRGLDYAAIAHLTRRTPKRVGEFVAMLVDCGHLAVASDGAICVPSLMRDRQKSVDGRAFRQVGRQPRAAPPPVLRLNRKG